MGSLHAKLSFYTIKKISIFSTQFHIIAYISIRPMAQNVSFCRDETHIEIHLLLDEGRSERLSVLGSKSSNRLWIRVLTESMGEKSQVVDLSLWERNQSQDESFWMEVVSVVLNSSSVLGTE